MSFRICQKTFLTFFTTFFQYLFFLDFSLSLFQIPGLSEFRPVFPGVCHRDPAELLPRIQSRGLLGILLLEYFVGFPRRLLLRCTKDVFVGFLPGFIQGSLQEFFSVYFSGVVANFHIFPYDLLPGFLSEFLLELFLGFLWQFS